MNEVIEEYINPLNIKQYSSSFSEAKPYRFIVVDNFLTPEFCHAVCQAYPSYKEAQKIGQQEFKKADEYRKIQITSADLFPGPVQTLAQELCSDNFCHILSEITGIEDLVADNKFRGAGMHLMQTGAWLSPHVDFNHIEERMYRRLNVILYLNEDWEEGWGGALEIWDPEMKTCMHVVPPIFNRAVIFNTVPGSFHGVLPVTCESDRSRNTFASFYYTDTAPPEWEGKFHGTIWGSRPGEKSSKDSLMKSLSKFLLHR